MRAQTLKVLIANVAIRKAKIKVLTYYFLKITKNLTKF